MATDVPVKHTVSVFGVALKMEAVYSCETLVAIYGIIIQCHDITKSNGHDPVKCFDEYTEP
jgi:hypothetical protein